MNQIKIVVGYPPINSQKGTPLLSQNRQFQYFNNPTYIYPMIPAFAATMLQWAGYRVNWMDGVAQKKSYEAWEKELLELAPDFLILETKAPVVKKHWKIINKLKTAAPNLKIVLVGDHVTVFPYESFENSLVDYVIIGGDYDFVAVNLLNHINNNQNLEGGVYWRKSDQAIKHENPSFFSLKMGEQIANSGPASLAHDLDELPFIDRDLTQWQLYAYDNGNFKYKPGTYVYSGRDCWWGKCTFCVWAHTLNPFGSYRSFSAQRLFDEVKYLTDKYKFKEIFDDAGTLFVGQKLKDFCQLMIKSGYNKKVTLGCNMRFDALTSQDCQLMKQAGFRMVLYGMESGNQATLDRVNKGQKVEQIAQGAKMASDAGLQVHATVMIGYPWETYQEAKNTINLARECFNKGYFHTMQATVVVPYPGTPLWKECREKDWLLTQDYEDYDMRQPVMKSPISQEQIMQLTQELYSSFLTPRFILRKIMSIRSIEDIKFFIMAGKKLAGHLLDFDSSQSANWTNPAFWHHSLKAFGNNLIPKKKSKEC
ncbi:B12-binding domain-containing radical SAM protein [candidate division WWE3 bacterium CG08_land_8_20_14_0_20_43_13]|uniref:B12-binding domain-containing radical SAM protein n=1 Tax=candidate division WWE3 bacterium CG08_land_8_20_14_0_20_43_13 TaxID=1975087 RepID=A0A2H0X6K2_UNCKA|nr:MAG: B12-binding domain-containing radical SAM protein [candidate division WWE3 bacterium CG08_land_8_20_14_0_20_43_13]